MKISKLFSFKITFIIFLLIESMAICYNLESIEWTFETDYAVTKNIFNGANIKRIDSADGKKNFFELFYFISSTENFENVKKFIENEFSAHVIMSLHKNGLLIKIMECDINTIDIKYTKDSAGKDTESLDSISFTSNDLSGSDVDNKFIIRPRSSNKEETNNKIIAWFNTAKIANCPNKKKTANQTNIQPTQTTQAVKPQSETNHPLTPPVTQTGATSTSSIIQTGATNTSAIINGSSPVIASGTNQTSVTTSNTPSTSTSNASVANSTVAVNNIGTIKTENTSASVKNPTGATTTVSAANNTGTTQTGITSGVSSSNTKETNNSTGTNQASVTNTGGSTQKPKIADTKVTDNIITPPASTITGNDNLLKSIPKQRKKIEEDEIADEEAFE
jgi:hypothetical protein